MRRALLLVVLLLAGCGGSKAPQFVGQTLDSTVAPNFALHDQTGRTVTVSAQRGHWAVVTFLYTHCPDVCPIIAAHLNSVIRNDTGRRAGLRVLAVSVDPARDTPAAVKRYVADRRLAPAFHFLIGSPAQLERVWHAYHVAAQPGPSGTVTHSTYEILIDPDGNERLIYDATITADELTADLDKLL